MKLQYAVRIVYGDSGDKFKNACLECLILTSRKKNLLKECLYFFNSTKVSAFIYGHFNLFKSLDIIRKNKNAN